MKHLGGNVREVYLVTEDGAERVRKIVGPDRKDHAESEILNLGAFAEHGVCVPAFLGRCGEDGYDYEYIAGTEYNDPVAVSDEMLDSLAGTASAILGVCTSHPEALSPLPDLPSRLQRALTDSTSFLRDLDMLSAFEPYLETMGSLLSQDWTTCALCDMYVTQFIWRPKASECYLIDAEYMAALDPLYSIAALVTSMLNAEYSQAMIDRVRSGIERNAGPPLDWSRVGLWCGFNDVRFYAKHHGQGRLERMVELCGERIENGASVFPFGRRS